jgi:plastocyanin
MVDRDSLTRRTVLKATGAAASAALLAGCSTESGNGSGNGNGENGNGDGPTTVAAGPDNRNVFDPDEVTVSVGDTVVWEFESAGHNVVAWPDGPDQVSIPEGADGFGSVEEGGNYFTTLVEQGDTYEHTFETAGEYTYVCGPHAGVGMVGTVVVEE